MEFMGFELILKSRIWVFFLGVVMCKWEGRVEFELVKFQRKYEKGKSTSFEFGVESKHYSVGLCLLQIQIFHFVLNF